LNVKDGTRADRSCPGARVQWARRSWVPRLGSRLIVTRSSDARRIGHAGGGSRPAAWRTAFGPRLRRSEPQPEDA